MGSTGSIVLLSPHCDDIAYSLGGSLAAAKLPLGRCQIHTVFTRSAYCPFGELPETDVDGITALRLAEDRRFAKEVGVAVSHYDLPEPLLRGGYPSLESILVSRDRASSDPILNAAREVMLRIKRDRGPSCVFSPLAVGGHADHWIVRLAAESVFEGMIVYYEDLPYAGYFDEDRLAEELRSLPPRSQAVILPDDGWIEKKLALLNVYKSQIAPSDIAAVIASARRIGGERVWFRDVSAAAAAGIVPEPQEA